MTTFQELKQGEEFMVYLGDNRYSHPLIAASNSSKDPYLGEKIRIVEIEDDGHRAVFVADKEQEVFVFPEMCRAYAEYFSRLLEENDE